jgi:hemoglobin
MAPMTEPSLFDRVGGTPYFERLVDRFYTGVATDAVLLAVYPEHLDFAGPRHRLTLFLVQYWGGPTTYSDERGHPRLRMRHAPFAIGGRERDRWLVHMRAAIDQSDAPDDAKDELEAYFSMAAEAMRNREDATATG